MSAYAFHPDSATQEDVDVLEKELLEYSHQLIVYNDDVNTFDWVIESLIDVCEHTPEQAEQCSILIHYKGKCEVLTGELEDLKPRCTELLNRGLSAEII